MSKTCVEIMNSDNQVVNNDASKAVDTSNGDQPESLKKKPSIHFSVNAKPFVAKEQIKQTNVKPPTIQQQLPLNLSNLVNLQALQQLSNAAATINFQQQQLRQQQFQIPQVNHPLNQVLLNNQPILQNLNNLLASNFDKNRLMQQIAQQQASYIQAQPQFNMNDLTTVATLSNLASTILSCLPSSLQQFYSQLNNIPSPTATNHVNDLEALLKQQQNLLNKAPQLKPVVTKPLNEIKKAAQQLDPQEISNIKLSDGKTLDSQTYNSILLRNPNSKYALEYEWSFWFFKNNRDADWKENLILLTTVDNVEDFWSVFNHLRPVSDLHEGCDYMFFKKGIQPMWEDDENRDGGRWLISFDRDQRSTYLSTFWQNTLLSLIGSQYDKESALVNGAVVNVRFKVDKLSLWTKHYKDEKAQYKIGNRFKRVLGVTDGLLFYEIHDTNQIPQQAEVKAASKQQKY